MSSANHQKVNFSEEVREIYKSITNLDGFVYLLNWIEKTEFLESEFVKKPNPITVRHLIYLSKNSDELYTTFGIKKKSGGIRIIDAPSIYLKRVQRLISILLQCVFATKVNYYAYGFLFDRNICMNARAHVGKAYLLNMDIKDFFPSIEFRRVKAVLELNPFNLRGDKEKIAFIISNICCHNGVLPQGAPTSPILSTIVTQKLDRRIGNYIKGQNIRYTRYADDMSFSSNRQLLDSDFITVITEVVESEGFRIKEEKTRISDSNKHQEVTGIVVNKKLNIKRFYYKKIRTMLNNWEKGGLAYAEQEFISSEPNKYGYDFIEVLKGRISFIKQVRGEDELYNKLYTRFIKLKNRIDYSLIQEESVRDKLIQDNIKMEMILLDNIHNSESKFISFCTTAFHQIENLVNYYYWMKFPKIQDLLQELLNENPSFRKRYKILDRCGRFKKIRDLDINALIYLYEKEFYFDKGYSYRQELKMLRDIRNDESHRCEVDSIDKEKLIEKYNLLQDKLDRFKLKNGRDAIMDESEKIIDYDFRLIKFLEKTDYKGVRNIVKSVYYNICEMSND